MGETILEVNNLKINFKTYAGLVQAVRGVNFSLEKGKSEILTITISSMTSQSH